MNSLHERIAECLGWTVEETRQFSLPALRELVRFKNVKLTYIISDTIRRGTYIMEKSC